MQAFGSAESRSEFAIQMRGIRKVFGSLVANDQLNLDVKAGTIHGILGENGAGKSTAMKILFGMQQADEGEIVIHGQVVRISSPRDAMALGIGMVHQHFMLSDAQTVLDNIILGSEPPSSVTRFLPEAFELIDRRRAYSRLTELMQTHGWNVPLDRPIADLSVGMRQRVEILKLLYHKADIFILDEPTAVLTPQEVAIFFSQLKDLAALGKTILIVTHKLRELLAVTDSISIFRSGSVIATVSTPEQDAETLAALMIGKRLDPVRNAAPAPARNQPLLRVIDWALAPSSHVAGQKPCSLELYAGEILGVAGIEGNGQLELMHLLCSPKSLRSSSQTGRIEWQEYDMRSWGRTETAAAGIACIPADRHRQGLLLERSLVQNFALGYQSHPGFQWGPLVRWGRVRKAAEQALQNFDIQPPRLDLPVRYFSGGNQQKMIFAREIHHKPKLLIAVHPSRGVDVGAMRMIHQKLLQLRAEGMAILLISSELDELMALSDRILVMEKYRITASFERGRWDETALGMAMAGAYGDEVMNNA